MTIYLIVRQHSITKLKYFSKTNGRRSYYKGSGKYWKEHLKRHGANYVTNLEVYSFEDQEEATEFAIAFSYAWNIVESDSWANLIIEDAIGGNRGGAPIGRIPWNKGLHLIQNKNTIEKRNATFALKKNNNLQIYLQCPNICKACKDIIPFRGKKTSKFYCSMLCSNRRTSYALEL